MEWRLGITVVVLLPLISIATFLLLSDRFITPKHQAQEPPLVRQQIPFVGHVAGLFLHGMKYFEFMRYVKVGRYTRQPLIKFHGNIAPNVAHRPTP